MPEIPNIITSWHVLPPCSMPAMDSDKQLVYSYVTSPTIYGLNYQYKPQPKMARCIVTTQTWDDSLDLRN
jgi:hypothetical protein